MNTLPKYFKDYLDERFNNVEIRLINLLKEFQQLKENNEKRFFQAEEKIEKHEKWIDDFTSKITVISAFVGSVFSLSFYLLKEFLANVLKLR